MCSGDLNYFLLAFFTREGSSFSTLQIDQGICQNSVISGLHIKFKMVCNILKTFHQKVSTNLVFDFIKRNEAEYVPFTS